MPFSPTSSARTCFLGTLLISLFRATKLLDDDRVAQLATERKKVELAVEAQLAALKIARDRATGLYRLRVTLLGQLWSAWAAMADMYARLDYDNRANASTRLPFLALHNSQRVVGTPLVLS
jgi:hypothetical protein